MNFEWKKREEEEVYKYSKNMLDGKRDCRQQQI